MRETQTERIRTQYSVLIANSLIFFLVCNAIFGASQMYGQEPWKRHTIDDSFRGADGVRLADFNGDGLKDVVTGWEESGIVRLYLNPGVSEVRKNWPAVTVGKGKSPEDAVPFDVDGDGVLEIISCHEGKQRQVLVHRLKGNKATSPNFLEVANWVEVANWKSTPISRLDGQLWMFATPIKLADGTRGLVIGSKNAGATLTLVHQKDPDDKDIQSWQITKLRDCGWVMSIQVMDMDKDGDQDIVFSDRKSATRAIGWLEQQQKNKATEWVEHTIGATDTDPLFIEAKPSRVLATTRQKNWLDFRRNGDNWEVTSHDNPKDVPFGKAINSLTETTIVLTANTKADNSPTKQPGIWLQTKGKAWQAIGSTLECKFDRMELIDLDNDGDLDVMTCEERQQLGVVWYENPGIK